MAIVGEIMDRLLNGGGSGAVGGVILVAPMVAASATGARFFRDNGRLPSDHERHYLTNWSFLITVAWAAVCGVALVIGLLMIEPDYVLDVSGAFLIFFAVMMLISLVVTYALTYFGYGWVTRYQVTALLKKQQRKAPKL